MSRALAVAAIAGLVAGANAQAPCKSVIDAASEAGLSSLLTFATGIAGAMPGNPQVEALIAQLSQETAAEGDGVTVFAPSNSAFDEIAAVAATLSAEEQLTVLLNHIFSPSLTSADVLAALEAAAPADVSLTTLASFALDVSGDADGIFVTPNGSDISAEIVAVDVDTCIGTVHVVDKVLVPVFDQAVAFQTPELTGAYGEEDVDGVYGGDFEGSGAGTGGSSGTGATGGMPTPVPTPVPNPVPAPVPTSTPTPVISRGAGAGSPDAEGSAGADTPTSSSSGGISGATVGFIAGGAAAAVLAGVAAAMIYKKRAGGAAAGAGSQASGALSGTAEV